MDSPLPSSHLPYTDKYFIRTRRILAQEGMNPDVTVQVFIRQGPGAAYGLDEAVAILDRYAGGRCRVWALPEGAAYAPGDTVLRIEGRIQDIVELETMYLGVITARTSERNDGAAIDLDRIRRHAALIRSLLPGKQLIYFGARHWHWSWDEAICRTVMEAGFDGCATDIGARAAGLPEGGGTIPHALVLVFAHYHGRTHATREAALAFDRHIEPQVPRIALIDTFGQEMDDAVDTARAMGSTLWGVRIDTAGEVIGQGGVPFDGRLHWTGPGVTVKLVHAVRRALDTNGFESVHIVLSSGFGDPEKIRAFLEGERKHGRLFEAVGLGSVYQARYATADIVRIEGKDLAKNGRERRDNPRLMRRM